MTSDRRDEPRRRDGPQRRLESDARNLVAVVGAGPYGLSVAAHLRALDVPIHVFGEPLEYWRRHMPEGMRLRSPWRASSIASPSGRFSLAAYEQERRAPLERPIPLANWVEYARWYQQAVVPDVDARRVTRIEQASDRFLLTLSDGDQLVAARVVLATGLDGFPRRPPLLDALPPTLVSHTADQARLDVFAGKRLVVLGAGQSAIESAVLAHEAGAHVQVLARAPAVHWLTRSARLHEGMALLGRILYAPTDVGPAGLSWLVAAPDLMRRLPPSTRQRAIRRCLRPAASDWLRPRAEGITLTYGRRVVAATGTTGDGVQLSLDDGTVVDADHVLLGTGFQPHLDAVSILAPELRASIRHRDGQPLLRRGFETSAGGLHVVGALAAASFGPVMRFVSGTWYTAPALATHVARRHK